MNRAISPIRFSLQCNTLKSCHFNKILLNRRKRREQRLILNLSSLCCLRFLMFKKCVWLRLAALRSLRSFVAKSTAGFRLTQCPNLSES
jgi:hypothetical protein